MVVFQIYMFLVAFKNKRGAMEELACLCVNDEKNILYLKVYESFCNFLTFSYHKLSTKKKQSNFSHSRQLPAHLQIFHVGQNSSNSPLRLAFRLYTTDYRRRLIFPQNDNGRITHAMTSRPRRSGVLDNHYKQAH